MSATVTLTSECKVAVDEPLVPALREWLRSIPLEAAISPLIRETGHQRDPIQVLVGLRATWQEQR